MKSLRAMLSGAAALLLVGATLLTGTPANAQGGPNTGNQGCTQTATGGGGGSQTTGGGHQDSRAVLVGVVNAAVQDVAALNNNNLDLSGIAANLQVVCLNNVLNGNDIHILEDILNGSPILSGNLNESLNDNTILTNFLNANNIAANVEVVSVDLGSGQVFLLRQ